MDVSGRINQRGAWICPDRQCLLVAVEKGRFARAFGAPIIGHVDALYEGVMRVLHAEILNVLGLARTAGYLIAGRTEVSDAIAKDQVNAVVLAADLAERSARDMHQVSPDMIYLMGPTKTEIGQAIGRKPTGIIGLHGQAPLVLKALSYLKRWASLSASGQSRAASEERMPPN